VNEGNTPESIQENNSEVESKSSDKLSGLFDKVNNLMCEIEEIDPEDGYEFEDIEDAVEQLADVLADSGLDITNEQKRKAEKLMGDLRKAKESIEEDEDDDDEYVYKKIDEYPSEIDDDIVDLDDDRDISER
jgi:hypothetical protein